MIYGENIIEEENNNNCNESRLFIAIISQAVMDALNDLSHINKNKYEKKEILKNKLSSIKWLTERNRDFDLICDYAGYNPEYLRMKFRRYFKK